MRSTGGVSFSQISYDNAAWCTSISSGLIVPHPIGTGSADLSYARSKTQPVSLTLLILSWDMRVEVRIGVALTRRSASSIPFSKLLLASSPYEILLVPVALSASCRALPRVLFRILTVLFSLERQ